MRSMLWATILTAGLVGSCTITAPVGGGQTDVGFDTICGVSVPEESSRDNCKVVDYFKNGQKTQTDLNFPDFGLVLTWQPGNKVAIKSDGEDWGSTEYTTSEGETRFTVGRITYFYISDKELASRETGG